MRFQHWLKGCVGEGESQLNNKKKKTSKQLGEVQLLAQRIEDSYHLLTSPQPKWRHHEMTNALCSEGEIKQSPQAQKPQSNPLLPHEHERLPSRFPPGFTSPSLVYKPWTWNTKPNQWMIFSKRFLKWASPLQWVKAVHYPLVKVQQFWAITRNAHISRNNVGRDVL